MPHDGLTRREAVCLTLASALHVGIARAQETYPQRPIHLIVGTGPGASTDIAARLFADRLSKSLGQPVVVENRPGAGGLLATRTVLSARPDGYTIGFLFSDTLAIGTYLQAKPPFDPVRDFVHVGAMARSYGFIMAVHPSVAAGNLLEFLQLAKTSPKRLTFGTYGIGSIPHLGFEMLAARAGVELLHVPFKSGAESYQAALAGHVDAVAGTSFIDLLKSERLRPLAVGGVKRTPALPSLPTFAELGYGEHMFGPNTWSLGAPHGTASAITKRLANELRVITAMADVAESLSKVAVNAVFVDGEEYRKELQREIDVNVPLIRKLGLNKS